ncbi:MAG: Rieske 2Fe-2S domain-containing protein [Pseudonocardiales bacterium]|nr:Rieske 2Fe-2S domain-containing protein [Pseudonocardiales bacterium]MBV9652282.1 Rieske 2Fe-2S domain-containing protein [Pseudonocardiales bacterium]
MRVTGVGHAGLYIETVAGSVLCDPWVNPAFFGSWFPFPDNSDLDWDTFGQADYLYISHLHRDHFDPELLRRHVRKNTTVLLPDYPTDELERALAGLGFRTFLRTTSGVPVHRDGLRIMITSLTGPSDGPIGDSALSLDDGHTVILNQNDAHPLDIEQLRDFGEVHGYFTQFSGAIWWPMVYDLPEGARREFARRKRVGQTDRALRYIDAVDAAHVFPTAGPPCFLDEELFDFNGHGYDGASIFTDQAQFLAELHSARPAVSAHLLLPGSVADLDGSCCELSHRYTAAEITRIFQEKTDYLREYQNRAQPALAAEQMSRAPVPSDLLEQLKQWWEPLLKRAENICTGVGGPVRLDVGERSLVIDFTAREVREFAGEQCRYRLSTSADLVATNLTRREVDWSNSLFLSLRFRASRVGQYNEFVYVFFKCLSPERIDYVENWYDERNDDGADITLDSWRVQRRCPHLRADLAKFGSVSDGVLTCALHGWRFDLATGRCLTAAGHQIRAMPVSGPISGCAAATTSE